VNNKNFLCALQGAGLVFVTAILISPTQCLSATEIYQSTTSTGLPSYSHEPSGPDNHLYMTIGDPPPRPRRPRESVVAMVTSARTSQAYSGLPDLSIENLVIAASKAYGVPVGLLLAVMHAESGFNPKARSPVGAIGLMQIMPPTGARYGVRHSLADPLNNIDVGARYLRDLLKLFDGNKELAVAAYNAGEGAVMKYGRRIPPYAETRAYVPKVMGLYVKYKDWPKR
jgi:hypothetical protein